MAASLFGDEPVSMVNLTPVSQAVSSPEKQKLEAKMSALNSSDKNEIQKIKDSLNPADFNSINTYSGSVGNVTSGMVEGILKSANSTALDSIGGGVNNILMTAKQIDAKSLVGAKSKTGLSKLLPWFFVTKERLMAQFSSLGTQIEKYAEEINKGMVTCKQSIVTMEGMGKDCVQKYNLLEGIILAGKVKIIELREALEIEKNAFKNMDPAQVDPLKIQELQKKENFVDTLEKKVSNFEQMQQVIYMQIPQLTVMIKNSVDAQNEFQAILDTTIPLWKSQFAQALILDQQKRAGEVIEATKNFTNDMMKSNADMLKDSTLKLAEQGARGLVDQSTLEHVQSQLISTIEGTLQIHQKASEQRKQMSESIGKMRLDFKAALQGK